MIEAIQDAEKHMKKSLEVLQRELAGLRAGRAHPAILEKVQVDYYGVLSPITHLATVSVPEPRVLVVQPFDKSVLPAMEKAIQKADLGVGIRNEGTMLRLTFPPLTEERRKELVRQVHKLAEEGRVAVRNARRDALERLRQMLKDHQLSEDEERRAQNDLQKLTDRYVKEVDDLAEARELDILTP
ncbi:ribosome recycling factor [Candidatus Hydrogenisulfobacillus filiaventi]|uniref:Ribosome-recycling factor n=1 Tax=Candidatus Hydrogenisulfobacillus filiaventi TaxID=2707344 RepID=A0A6F8ZG80_9FIRM|nr:ribosome recycling factor [Bacillota bacterium]CAB1128758.1 ribosome recycling factor [Candidatus Hydrogenisulfobacillus filiaventi]